MPALQHSGDSEIRRAIRNAIRQSRAIPTVEQPETILTGPAAIPGAEGWSPRRALVRYAAPSLWADWQSRSVALVPNLLGAPYFSREELSDFLLEHLQIVIDLAGEVQAADQMLSLLREMLWALADTAATEAEALMAARHFADDDQMRPLLPGHPVFNLLVREANRIGTVEAQIIVVRDAIKESAAKLEEGEARIVDEVVGIGVKIGAEVAVVHDGVAKLENSAAKLEEGQTRLVDEVVGVAVKVGTEVATVGHKIEIGLATLGERILGFVEAVVAVKDELAARITAVRSRKPGPTGNVLNELVDRMEADVRNGAYPFEKFDTDSEQVLAIEFGAAPSTAARARREVKARLLARPLQ
jgi:hypothetical protein